MSNTTTGYDVEPIAYPVGEANDSYHIGKWFTLNTITNQVTVQCAVKKNIYGKREDLFAGTYSECYQFIADLIKDI